MKLSAMIKKMCPSDSELSIPAKNCYRMVILGSSKVGKTAIVSRFLTGRFEDAYTPTIEDFHRKLYSIRGEVYQLDILDTSGNHPFPAMRRLSILTGERDGRSSLTIVGGREFCLWRLERPAPRAPHAAAGAPAAPESTRLVRQAASLTHSFFAPYAPAGDVFILVFSLDNRDSFEEVQRLKQQILDTKSCLKNKTKEDVDVPLVICGNKGDRDFYREVEQREIEQLVGDDPQRCAYFEISAKKNSSLDQMFRALFAMAKLPSEMSPDLHRKVSVQYCDVLHKKALRNKKLLRAGSSCGGGRDLGDAFGIVAPFARRPSVHSDLLYIREKAQGGSQAKDKERCVIS
ncbi:dexamethasone-induced Ras-related protein 1 isoform X1 [Nycticebus coucang]|uniref:dexamethasone-induced Ras-related protein 1 isoform X1 n=1 Tax=Nycticebus coucang TaxID=9470 RepID=UPI00234C5CBD|nr:dexamethasone-induced Ras-related protein 1 isoform X1 [Nycticebus coucang]